MYGTHWIDAEKLDGWGVSIEKVVGGFIWLGFSKAEPWKMLCISGDKTTIFDCESGNITKTDCAYDEDALFALCEDLKDDMIPIAGQYGGSLPQTSPQGDMVTNECRNVFEYGKELVRERVFFTSADGAKHEIYEGYTPYIYGFSYDGNYFVFAHDGGVTVLKRKNR